MKLAFRPLDVRKGKSDVQEGVQMSVLSDQSEREEEAKMVAELTRQMIPRPPLESYVRVTVERDGHCYEPAVEYRASDTFRELADALRCFAIDMPLAGDAMARALALGAAIARHWPGRAYFVEVWQLGAEGFAQVFQPYGVPRNR